MKRRSLPLLVAAALAMGGCTSMPTGPSVMVLPGSHKTYEQFRGDDLNCRHLALDRVSGASPSQASGNASGTGYSGYDAQQEYDAAYLQCMYAAGHRVPAYGPMLAAPPARPPANYRPDFLPPAPQGRTP